PELRRLRGGVVDLADQHVVAGPRGDLRDAGPHDAASDDTDSLRHVTPRRVGPGGLLRSGGRCMVPRGPRPSAGVPAGQEGCTPSTGRYHDAAGTASVTDPRSGSTGG